MNEPFDLGRFVSAQNSGDTYGQALEELRAASTASYVPAYNIAMLQNGLGDREAALDSLEEAVRRHDVRLILLKVEHKWDDLRSEPRFEAVFRRVGFQ